MQKRVLSRVLEKSLSREQPMPPVNSNEPHCTSLFYTGAKSIDKIEVLNTPLAQPTEHQIRIAVKYAGVNFLDVLKKLNLYPVKDPLPFVSGCELSGIVDSIGAKVKNISVGDRVMALQSKGCFTSSLCIDESDAFKLPNEVSLEDAAAICINYVTAYNLLFDMASLSEHDVILLPQASGGVGHAVIQLARTVPNVTIIALCSAHKHEYMRSLGVKHVIDYRSDDYEVKVKELYPAGVDLVLDSMNGEDSVKAFDLLKPFGKVIHYGIASIANQSIFQTIKGWYKSLTVNSLKLIDTNKMVAGYNLNTIVKTDRQILNRTVGVLTEMMSKGQIKPKIDAIYPLASGKEALQRLLNRQNTGKILLCPEAESVQVFSTEHHPAGISSENR